MMRMKVIFAKLVAEFELAGFAGFTESLFLGGEFLKILDTARASAIAAFVDAAERPGLPEIKGFPTIRTPVFSDALGSDSMGGKQGMADLAPELILFAPVIGVDIGVRGLAVWTMDMF